MLGWPLYLRIALKVGSLALFITGSKFEYWFFSRSFTIFSKKVFKTSAVFKSAFIFSLLSVKLICSLTNDLSESEGFITFPKSLLPETLFSSKFA